MSDRNVNKRSVRYKRWESGYYGHNTWPLHLLEVVESGEIPAELANACLHQARVELLATDTMCCDDWVWIYTKFIKPTDRPLRGEIIA